MNKIKLKNYVPILIIVALSILSYLMLKPFLVSIFLGALLAYIFLPVYKKISKKLNKTFVALLICVIIIILIVLPSAFFVKTLVNESYSLYVTGKEKFANGLFEQCSGYICNLIKTIGENPQVEYQLQEGLKTVTNLVIKKGSDILVSIPQILLNLFIMFFVLFYFLKEGEVFVKKISNYISMQKKKYARIINRLREIIKAIIYGYLLIALMQGALGALGFFLFGISSPLFWGMIMAFLALIPYLGTGIIWGPAAIFLFLDGMFNNSNILIYKGIGLFLYGLIIVGSLDNFLKPKIISGKAKIHPAIIMLGIFGGIFLLGPIGVIVGPLVLSLTAIVIEEYLSTRKH